MIVVDEGNVGVGADANISLPNLNLSLAILVGVNTVAGSDGKILGGWSQSLEPEGWTETVPERSEMRPAWSGGSFWAKEVKLARVRNAAQADIQRTGLAEANKRISVFPFLRFPGLPSVFCLDRRRVCRSAGVELAAVGLHNELLKPPKAEMGPCRY